MHNPRGLTAVFAVPGGGNSRRRGMLRLSAFTFFSQRRQLDKIAKTFATILGVVFLLGKRKGKRQSTTVEIRRV